MPDRYNTAKNPRDFTGHKQHLQYIAHQKEIDKDLERQRQELATQAAMAKPQKVVPVVFETKVWENFVDYTTPNAAQQPKNEPKA